MHGTGLVMIRRGGFSATRPIQRARHERPARCVRARRLHGLVQSPLGVRPRDQTRVKVSPSPSAKRLAKIGALKLGSSSLTER